MAWFPDIVGSGCVFLLVEDNSAQYWRDPCTSSQQTPLYASCWNESTDYKTPMSVLGVKRDTSVRYESNNISPFI